MHILVHQLMANFGKAKIMLLSIPTDIRVGAKLASLQKQTRVLYAVSHFIPKRRNETVPKVDSQSALADMINRFLTEQSRRL